MWLQVRQLDKLVSLRLQLVLQAPMPNTPSQLPSLQRGDAPSWLCADLSHFNS